MVRVNQFVGNYVARLQNSKTEVAHSPSQAVFGTLILWLGWLLFNGGSSAGITGDNGKSAQIAIVNTILAPSAGGIFTFLVKGYIVGGSDVKMDFQALTNGILAGLVSITANCDAVEPWAAVIIGALGGLIYCLACKLMDCLQIDDPLEATQVHGFCGIWGCVATAFFKKNDGIFYGGEKSGELLGIQLLGCLLIIVWSGLLSAIFFGIAHGCGLLRIPPEYEILGGDLLYFGPREFTGTLDQVDVKTNIEMVITKSPFRAGESDFDGTEKRHVEKPAVLEGGENNEMNQV